MALTNTTNYTYDRLGHLYETSDNNGTTKYTCDKAGPLIQVQYPGSMRVLYQYNAEGNRMLLTDPDGTCVIYEHDALMSKISPARRWVRTVTMNGPPDRPDLRQRRFRQLHVRHRQSAVDP